MANKYVNFIDDEHFIKCIDNLYNAYSRSKKNISKNKFYKNKIDIFKLTFDSKFNNIPESELIKNEILRQIDKAVNNSIGTFHEEILGGIEGYKNDKNSGYDIKAIDDTLFADIKNKHNTVNSSSAEALFQKLKRFADDHKKAKCYWVQILAKSSFNELWRGEINGKEYSHSRVYKISGDKFYGLLTGEKNAFYSLYKALPHAIRDYLKLKQTSSNVEGDIALDSIKDEAKRSDRSILDQIVLSQMKMTP